jgi:uncharacterized protein YdaU (DUF1376 family)
LNYYPRHIGDYLKDTAHLSLLEHGIYSRLLDVYYSTEAPIEAAQVFRLIGARSRDERAATDAVLTEFFALDGTAWRHARCDRELLAMQSKQAKARESAAKRWDNRPSNANASPVAMPTHSEGNAPNTNTNTKEGKTARKRAAPDGVSPQVWDDFLTLRKAKRAPVTQTTIDGAREEAAKAGMPLEAFLRIWCRRGSQGLEAAWLKPEERQAVTVPNSAGLAETAAFTARMEKAKVEAVPMPSALRDRFRPRPKEAA